MLKSTREIMDWLDGQLKKRVSKKLANNTYAERREDGGIDIRLHNTIIVSYAPDGTVTLNSGGWRTVTTKSRIDAYIPDVFHIIQEDGIWYIRKSHPGIPWREWRKYPFCDGMTIGPMGGIRTDNSADKKAIRLKKKINAYIDGFVAKLKDNDIPAPSGVDCWYCCVRTQEGKSLGDAFNDQEHLLSHIEDKYYVPSLLLNAMKERSSKMGLWALGAHWGYEGIENEEYLFEEAKRSLRSYLYTRLGIAR